ncbi:uncharacterized protein LOC114727230 [Neltuma alba]|uniref:uncharacterized protein LOC114727230 n=1 Tax=Neltuma alba TaxID=207710 RepID=UPI0010A4B214|nr:uncharacterized protein LOC114727230 [Prosopis alba]
MAATIAVVKLCSEHIPVFLNTGSGSKKKKERVTAIVKIPKISSKQMDPTCGLVEKVRDVVLGVICEQLRYLIHYHRNIEELSEQLMALALKRNSIQHQVDMAKNNVEEIEEEVLRWSHKVNEISEQVQRLHKESQAKRECSITSCPNPWLRSKLSARAKAMTQQVVEICGNGNFNTVSYRVPPQSMPQLTNRESNEGIGSRVPIMNQIMEALRNPSVNMIGLCGLGGVGKTTIAKEVARNQKMFEKVIMTTVSKELNVEKIQGKIAEKLGLQLNEKAEDVRTARLCARLKQEKNMLLILDDLWEELDLGKVGIPFVEGCKILLTSRNEILLSKDMKCQEIIKVGVLLEDEPWELFKRIAELSVDSSSPELLPTANAIVRKCGGLPLVIATAAKALKNKDLNDWKDALARLNNPMRRNNTLTKEGDTILKLSYNHLSSSEYKHIFLLAAMLSHDPSIEDLLMYSVGLDVLNQVENMEEAHAGISAIVSKLKSLSLFLDSFSSHYFTMHDVIRDVALSIASSMELCAFIVKHGNLKEWPDENMLKRYKGIYLQESDISDFPNELHGPRLEFFLLNSKKLDLTIPSMFFKSSKELKVLAFTNVHFLLLPSLSFLQKLKTLCLHSCLLEDITEVRRLKNLKVLSLAYSEIQQLPIELAELTSLQMLNLSHCSKLKVIPQKLLSSLKNLEVLHMGNSFNLWKVEGSAEANDNASLDELKDLPISFLDIHIPNASMLPENLFLDMNLKRYKIFIGKHWEWLGNYEASKILKLELESSIHLKRGLPKLLEGVEDMYLYGCNGLANVLYGYDGRRFPHLRHLHIQYVVFNSAHHEAATNNISNQICSSLFNKKVLLPKLEILELSNLNPLIPGIWDDHLSDNSFGNLKTLIVKSCGFEKLVPLHVLKSLNSLEELEVKDCDLLEMVFDFEDLNDDNEMVPSSMSVPLKRLMLQKLPRLKNVWRNHRQGNASFQSLRSIHVSFCESLTSVFPSSIAKDMLRDLEELRIANCGIDVIVAKDQVSESATTIFKFPKLISLELSGLPNLRNFYPHRHMIECSHLQRLLFCSCDNLEIFEKQGSSLSEIHEEGSTLDSKYPLLSYDKVDNLEELRLWGKEAEMIGSGQFPMYRFPRVKILYLRLVEPTIISYKSLWESFPKLDELELWGGIRRDTYGGDDVVAFAAPFSKLTIGDIFLKNLGAFLLSSPNLTHLHLKCNQWLTALITSSIARSLVHLMHLSISQCNRIEEIITKPEGENDENREIVFGKLEFLKLYRLPRLKRFCSHSCTLRFPLLDQLMITNCPKFKIFSPGLIDTPCLKSVQLLQDRGKRQQFWDTNLKKTIYQQQFVASGVLVLDESDQFPVDQCPRVDILRIERSVYKMMTLLERFPQLKALHVQHSPFEEIFPSQAHIVDHTGKFPPLKEVYLANMDELKHIWRNDSQLPTIQNLEVPHVENCSSLITLAPSSTSFDSLTVLVSKCHQLVYLVTNHMAKSLVNLETLEMNDCKKIEEIVTKQKGEDDEDKEILFCKLKFLKLDQIPALKRFCGHNYTFRFPSLDQVIIINCPTLKIFSPGLIDTPSLKSVQLLQDGDKPQQFWGVSLNKTIYQQQLASREGVLDENDASIIWNDQFPVDHYPQVEILRIERFLDEWIAFPYALLERFPQMNALHVKDSSFEEIFPSHAHIVHQIPPFGELHLANLHQLKNIWKDDSHLSPIQNLQILNVENCSHLIKLAPSSTLFNNLTVLKVLRCHQLIYLMTSSTAKSLVNLETLEIYDCRKMEKLVMNETNEAVEGRITFNALRILELTLLPRLKTEEDKTDFNSEGRVTSRNIFRSLFSRHKVSFPKLEILELCLLNSLIPPIWDDKLSHNSFGNLKTLTVRRCRFVKLLPLHVLKSLNNLEELEVTSCDMLETVFDFEDLNDYQEMVSSSVIVPLKKLTLDDLPKLRNVLGNNDRQGEINLVSSRDSSCHQIEELMTKQKKEDNENKKIIFSKLEYLELDELPRLKRFCSQNYTFKFPLLQFAIVTECPQLTIFCSGAIHAPLLQKVRVMTQYGLDHIDIWMTDLNATIQHGFTIQEVISTTRSMALNAENIMMIRNVFPKVRTLYVESFKDEGVTFPYRSLERFPMLEKLYVENSSFEEVFPPQDEIIDFMGKIPPFEELHIAYLDQLKSIWKDDSQLPPIHQDLIKCLEVESCHSLVRLAPSFASFQNLWKLSISGCHQLVYLVTSSTAKSLASLERLGINDCKKMEEIVLNENNEGVEGGITLNRLQRIELTDVPSLKICFVQER